MRISIGLQSRSYPTSWYNLIQQINFLSSCYLLRSQNGMSKCVAGKFLMEAGIILYHDFQPFFSPYRLTVTRVYRDALPDLVANQRQYD